MTNHELNNLVAEKIMGWRRDLSDWKTSDNQFTNWDVYDWEPSENIRCAWMVVEKMDTLGWCCQIANNTVGDEKFSAHFWWNKMNQSKIGFADSPSKAVCIAALKALGVEL